MEVSPEEECDAWLLSVENNLDDSSLTFDAVQWALARLQKIEVPEPLKSQHSLQNISSWEEFRGVYPCFVTWSECNKLQSSKTSYKKSFSGLEASCTGSPQRKLTDASKKFRKKDGTDCKPVSISKKKHNSNDTFWAQKTDLNVVPDSCQDEMSTETRMEVGEDMDVDTSSQGQMHMDAEASYMDVDTSIEGNVPVDMNVIIAENIRVCDRGTVGYNVAVAIMLRLNQCSLLVNLIEHCLLVSLDQDKPSHLKQAGNQHSWLHSWIFNFLFSQVSDKPEVGNISDMDWLLAYLSAAFPNNFITMLLEAVTDEISSKKSDGKVVPLSTVVRMANILEYLCLRSQEFAVSSFISSFMLIDQLMTTPNENPNSHKSLTPPGSSFLAIWLIIGFLCPSVFSYCINLLISTPDKDSVHRWWCLFWNSDFGALPLPDIYNLLMDSNSDKLFNLTDWLCVILRRRLNLLCTSASDIVLVLSDLCSDSEYQKTTDMIEAAHVLLEIILNETYNDMLQMITGVASTEGDVSPPSLLGSLRHHIMNLWSEVLKKGNCFSSCKESPFVSEHPTIYICLSVLFSCEMCITSQTFVYSTGCIYSFEEEKHSSFKLGLLLRAMKFVSGKDNSQDMFDLWAENLVNQVCTLPPDDAYERLLVVLNLLKLSSGEDSSAGSSEAIKKPSSKAWLLVHDHLCKALSFQWLRLLSLLHWKNASDLGLIVLSVLEFLSIKNPKFKDIIPRLKGSLGLFFTWLDEAYVCEQECSKVDKRWEIIQLIEKLKSVIVKVSAAYQMSFMVMINNIVDYSFSGVRGYFPEATSAKLQVTRLNRYGRQTLHPPLCNTKCSKGDKKSQQGLAQSYPNSTLETSSFVSTQLGNLLRKTIALIEKNGKQFQPATLLTKLLIHRLETPTEGPVTKKQYEEVLPKSLPSSRNVFLSNCFAKNPLLFEILEIVLENSESDINIQCLELLTALLAQSITFWYGGSVTEWTHKCDSFLIGYEETDRVQVCRLIRMISMTGWIPKPLASSSEVISVIEREDISQILFLIWRYLPDHQMRDSLNGNEDGTEEWEGQYLSILRRNAARLGPQFSHIYPVKPV